MEIYKRCTKCGEEKPATSEYYYKDCSRKDGFHYICKSCKHQQSYQYGVRYNTEHKKEKSEYCASHKEEKARYDKQYRDREYKLNPEKVRQQNREWAATHPDNCNVRRHRRRSLKKTLLSTYTEEQWAQCKEYFDNCCAYCGSKEPLQQEHFIPVVKGGGYTDSNILPSCMACNSSKRDKLFSEWYPKYKHYSKKREILIIKYLNGNNIGVQTEMKELYESTSRVQ